MSDHGTEGSLTDSEEIFAIVEKVSEVSFIDSTHEHYLTFSDRRPFVKVENNYIAFAIRKFAAEDAENLAAELSDMARIVGCLQERAEKIAQAWREAKKTETSHE